MATTKDSQYSGKGLTGLINLGNSCYINSSLQVLGQFHELNDNMDDFFSKSYDASDINCQFMKEWNDLRVLMWSRNVVVSPNRFKKAVEQISLKKNNDAFVGFDQNDAAEFITFLLTIFHDALKKDLKSSVIVEPNNKIMIERLREECKEFNNFFINMHKSYSSIDELFTVYSKSEYCHGTTGEVLTTTYENMYAIDLPLTSLNVKDCLRDYFSDEHLNEENDNQYFCDKTQSYINVVKRTTFFHGSKYLIIQLKRWNHNLKKNQRIIHYDVNEDLEMSDYLSSPKTGFINYEIFAIINHSGSIFGGHYTSIVKNANNKWYHYNDATITEIPENKILGNKNYCLVYRLK